MNLVVVELIFTVLYKLNPREAGLYKDLIEFIKDGSGHDQYYAIDASKLEDELDWKALETFDNGIHRTVQWYLDND